MKDLFDKILVFDLDDTIIDTRGIKIILFGIANELGIRDEATLEIYNLANLPVTLYPGMKICQFSFVQMTGPAQYPYGHKKLKSHYLNQKGATGANTRSIWGRK